MCENSDFYSFKRIQHIFTFKQFDVASRVDFGALDLTYLEAARYEAAMRDMFADEAKLVGIWPRTRR